MTQMICRLLKKLAWIVLLATIVSACTVDTPTRYATSEGSTTLSQDSRGHATATSSHQTTARANTATPAGNGAASQDTAQVQEPSIISTVQSPVFSSNNFWDHLHADFQLPPSANKPEVQEQINWYVHHQQYLDRIVVRAAPYLYYILERVQERDLPGELVLLPIMESAYNPFANSYRGAVGLWQLMTPTAGNFGVKQDWWYDGRRDIFASTNAALDYLTYLQSYFGGDWMLAIAAYDAGEGTLQVAVRRNERQDRNTDFWSLQLPMETRSYVPRLLALAAIISNPSKYGITLPNISDQPYIQQVDIGVPINLAQAAQLAGMNLADLKRFNPGYSHMTTDPNGPYKLLLPVDHIPVFKQNLAQMPGLSKTVWSSYRVQHHDTLSSIAKRYHTTIAQLRETNHIHGLHASPGKILMIPTGTVLVKPHIAEDNSPINNANPKLLSKQNALANNYIQPDANTAVNADDSDDYADNSNVAANATNTPIPGENATSASDANTNSAASNITPDITATAMTDAANIKDAAALETATPSAKTKHRSAHHSGRIHERIELGASHHHSSHVAHAGNRSARHVMKKPSAKVARNNSKHAG